MNSPPPRPIGATRWLAALGAAAIAFAALGCPGELDPEVARNKLAGVGGGTGGGVGGGTGGGGPGGSGSFCDAPGTIISTEARCAASICHGPTSTTGADLDLSRDGLVGRLLGMMPTGLEGSVCGSVAKPYLVAGSDPAEGLLLDKLFNIPPECGLRMPIGVYLDAAEEACVRDWARGVTTGAITQ